MARRQRNTFHAICSLLLGLLGTAAAVAAHLAGLDGRAELHALDWRFRHASRWEGTGQIVHVDVDDGSLAELGRWPWPRQTLAGIVEALAECGARTIALDVILPEPQPVRYVRPAGEVYRGAEAELIGEDRPVPVLDDALLAGAIARAGNVLLPMHVELDPPPAPALQRAAEEALLAEPGLPAGELAARLGRGVAEVEAVLPRARQAAIEARAEQAVAAEPSVSLQALAAELLPGVPEGELAAERQMLEAAYLRARAVQAVGRFAVPPGQVAGCGMDEGRLVPPLVPFAQAAQSCGFVTFQPDTDGAVRRIPLLARAGGRAHVQFALALAAHELARRHGGQFAIAAGPAQLTVRCADGTARAVPVDALGRMLINWLCPARPDADHPSGRRHIPAAAVAALWQQRAQLDGLEDLAHALRVELLNLGRKLPDDENLQKLYWDFADDVKRAELDEATRRRMAAERDRQRALLYRPGDVPDEEAVEELRRAEARLDAARREAVRALVERLREGEALAEFLGRPGGPDTAPAAGGADYPAARRRAERILAALDALPAQRQRIAAEREALAEQLRRIVDGRICLIGSTSTGAADFVPSPVSPRTAGVIVHANILDTILSGRFISRADAIGDLVTILAGGTIVALLAATRPVLQAALAAVLLAAGYAAFNAFVVFGVWQTWLAMVAPLGAMAASFLAVSVYRQLTEERAKRQIRDLFAHAMSPVLVDRLLEDPSLVRLGGEQRTVSCMFSDLAGFTPLSEALGPQQTVRVLNRYFDRVTEAVQNRCGGYLNKFLGDGIFVFFGAPVFQPDHAARAVRAAVECQQEVQRLNGDLGTELGREVRLSVRIGITTGEAMVGNCGSTQRMDYTAVGDCVNLASRLEEACKFFGARVLLDEATWRAGGDSSLPARPLGRVYVAGLSEPVRIWEVLGAAEDGSPELRAALDDFAAAVDRFEARDFEQAERRLRRVLAAFPDDRAAQVYLDLCRQEAAGAVDEQPRPSKADGVVRVVRPRGAATAP